MKIYTFQTNCFFENVINTTEGGGLEERRKCPFSLLFSFPVWDWFHLQGVTSEQSIAKNCSYLTAEDILHDSQKVFFPIPK